MIKTVCPECGAVDSISRYRDVRYYRSILGVGADGTIVISEAREYPDAGDDGFLCGSCGEDQYHDDIVKATLAGTPFA